MTIDNIRLRNEFVNTQVITREEGKRLGVVKEVLVDIDQREVVALGLRDNMFSISGVSDHIYITSICQIGDVILVDNQHAVEIIDTNLYSPLINCEVITESGESLGRVRDFQFDLATGKVLSIIIASLGYPQIPDQILSTYEISMDEVVSNGPNRLIVFEGAEERLTQLTMGFLQRLGVSQPPWDKDDEDYLYSSSTTRPENQLGTGTPVRDNVQTRGSSVNEQWNENTLEEPVTFMSPMGEKNPIRYQEYENSYEETNWEEIQQEEIVSQSISYKEKQNKFNEEQSDVWEDKIELESYTPNPVNISEKQVEYHEEEA
ncbi:MAG: PRC-barrel domain-containing protein [Candidatus Atelocyanobacterium thalassa]|uniref:PRC-barrel domain-containing protein n=1 Tax=Candidatus Atelocyanobacterium thalassa isolate SIO64986 TaxID=1527444 RepID=A0A086CHR1_9CHRO|nr:MAG: hypothetical protein ucyna2_00349 [Candidatus Atelocyanobacterium thalassa isolate SIO64986]